VLRIGKKQPETLPERAEELLEEAGKSLHELGREARHRADDAKVDMVKTLFNAAATLRKEAREAGATRDVRDQVDNVAKGFERAGTYLKRHSYEDIGEDVVEGVKTNPWRLLAVIFVVGLVIGLIMRGNQPQPTLPAQSNPSDRMWKHTPGASSL
jgi:ElaB/YqjD/DUF883 family membrane-anchored ribosome-binding protein